MKHKFSNYIFLLLLSVFSCISFSSCNDEDPIYPSKPDPPKHQYDQQTVLMYMPWSGSGIYPYLLKNISSFETAIEENKGLDGNALIVFISENEYNSNLIKITYQNGKCVRDTVKSYYFPECDYTSPEGIAEIINDAIETSPAETYSMTIGCHGMGWLPIGVIPTTRSRASGKFTNPLYLTRFFGHSSDTNYQTNISTLAEAINSVGVKMEYILFDDCYMSNIETAYELRNVTDYLIASTSEIMIDGMPYAQMGIDLLNNNFKAIADEFYSFYSTYNPPCGTIGITNCQAVEDMAHIMKEINSVYPEGIDNPEQIQTLDGYSPTVFFDFADYVSNLCKDTYLLSEFNNALTRLVPYKADTGSFYSMLNNKITTINSFSGLTISDPTRNTRVTQAVKNTSWYKATH